MTRMFLMKTTLVMMISASLVLTARCFRPDVPFELITVKMCHTYVHTNALETFTIPFLVADHRTPHTVIEAITAPVIVSTDHSVRLPLELVAIEERGNVQYAGQSYASYQYVLRPMFHADDFVVNIDEALLQFDLDNGGQSRLSIGAFNYIFTSEMAEVVTVSARYNVHIKHHDIPTSSGMILRIENSRPYPVELSKLSLNCAHIVPDMSALIPYDAPVAAHLVHEDFEFDIERLFTAPKTQETAIIIDPGATLTFFVPFRYQTAGHVLDRYPVVMTLLGDGTVHNQIIDDFQFIRTHWFAAVHPDAHIRHDHQN